MFVFEIDFGIHNKGKYIFLDGTVTRCILVINILVSCLFDYMHATDVKSCFMSFISSRVSNGTGFSCPAGQRDRGLFIFPGIMGQRTEVPSFSRDNLATEWARTEFCHFAKGRPGTGF